MKIMHKIDKLVDNPLFHKAIPIPWYDDYVILAWEYDDLLTALKLMELNKEIILGIEIWQVYKKEEYTINSKDSFELSHIGWSITKESLFDFQNNVSKIYNELRLFIKDSRNYFDTSLLYSIVPYQSEEIQN